VQFDRSHPRTPTVSKFYTSSAPTRITPAKQCLVLSNFYTAQSQRATCWHFN